MSTGRERARAVADAVLYEGYLLYPYRADARKNRSRWQFGVLGPPGAHAAGLGEDSEVSGQALVKAAGDCELRIAVRFLHLQHRGIRDATGASVPELAVAGRAWLDWDEAVEQEITIGPCAPTAMTEPIEIPGDTDIETIDAPASGSAGAIVRTRHALHGEFELTVEPDGGYLRLAMTVRNTGEPAADQRDAIARSLIGAHVIAEVSGAEFVSLLEPPPPAEAAVARCIQRRCFPVLAGAPGDHTLLLISPIILYDHPEIAPQSTEPLYDFTEIDEILTLRVMTMTDEEKASARATDPRAARIVDRCDAMTAEDLARLHGILRDPHAGQAHSIPEVTPGRSSWDPLADNAVRSDSTAMMTEDFVGWRGAELGQTDSNPATSPSARGTVRDTDAGRTRRTPEIPPSVDGWDPLADNAVRLDYEVLTAGGLARPRGIVRAADVGRTRPTPESSSSVDGSDRAPDDAVQANSGAIPDEDPDQRRDITHVPDAGEGGWLPGMSAEELAGRHRVPGDPDPGQAHPIPEVPLGVDWWDPAADEAVRPGSDAVPIAGVLVSHGSRVRLHPNKRADIHDMFFDGRDARVTSVHADVDGRTHVGVVILDDPGADLHEWYGRYLYFDPDELEPLEGQGN